MPDPVLFNIQIASLPPGFRGDPQALATAIAERLLISPSEPWSSFINGGSQPSSNVGPFLAAGVQWKVWSDALGAYTFQTLDGAGLVNLSVTRDALEDGTPNSVFVYNEVGRPIMQSGVPGQVLTVGPDLKPAFSAPASGISFVLQLSTNFDYNADGSSKVVPFDTSLFASNMTPDLPSHRIPVPGASVWYFGASLQIENINGPQANVQHSLNIRPYQLDGTAFGSIVCYVTALPRQGIQTGGLYFFQNPGFVDCTIASVDTSHAVDFSVSNNGINTRFYGYRLT